MEGHPSKLLPFPKHRCHLTSKHILMIIEFQVFCKDYSETILNRNRPFDYSCPKCHAVARFHRHGCYSRWVAILSEETGIEFVSLSILRLKCQSCQSTHSILPGDIIPFQIYSIPVVFFLCSRIVLEGESVRATQKNTNVSAALIRQKLALLKRSVPYLEFYLRQVFLYTASASLGISQAITFLSSESMSLKDYFHCHGHPLFLNRRTTPSFPFFFSAASFGFPDPT